MFQHPLLSHHNGNSWVPQLSMPSAGDVRAAPNFQGAQLLADEVATFGSDMLWERGRAPTVEGNGGFCDQVALVRCSR